MGSLSEWANKNSQWIKLNDGDSYSGIYGGFKIGDYKGNEVIEYKINDKILSSTSKQLAVKMDRVPLGATMTIIRFGTGPDTKYSIKVEELIHEEIQNVDEEPANWNE